MQVNSTESQRFAFRLALFYATLFAGFGVYMPFFPVWLQARGLDDSQIGIMLAAVTLTRIVVTPLFTRLADKSSSLKNLIFACAIGATLILPLLVVMTDFRAMLITLIACCVFWGPLTPLSDAYCVQGIVKRGLDYGKIRAWGSIAFLVAALVAGVIKTQIALEHLIWVQWVTLALTVIGAVLLLPDYREAPTASKAHRKRPRYLTPGFLLVCICGAIIQGSHALQYGFSSIQWGHEGYSGFTIGILWSLGILSEIMLFLWGRRFIDRSAPLDLMMFGAFAAILRWCIATFDPPLAILMPLQLLHAGSFGLTHMAIITYITRSIPASGRAGALGWSTIAAGLALALLTIWCGSLYSTFGIRAYWVMAVLALAGLLLAFALKCAQPQSDGAGGNTVEPS